MSLFASAIREKRKELGLSCPELSRLSGIHQAIIYRLEHDMDASDKNRWLLVETLKIPFDSEMFAKRVKDKRKSLGWAMPELSKVTKVSVSVIYLIESNKKLPSMALCYKLAKTLNLSLEEFIPNATGHNTEHKV
jgi:transcriptional regulator with XRE-family HTH domain